MLPGSLRVPSDSRNRRGSSCIRAGTAHRRREPNVLLKVEEVTKRYRRSPGPANDGVELAVDSGQVYGLLGHKGAGKTTLVNQVVGLLEPDSGRSGSAAGTWSPTRLRP